MGNKMLKSSQLMGYWINNASLNEIVVASHKSIIEEKEQKKPLVFSCANPHSLAIAESNQDFRHALAASEILVTDGVGLSLIGGMFGYKVNPRITGSDFFYALMNNENQAFFNRKIRVVFFGSSPKVLSLIKEKMLFQYTNIECCDFISPPYGEWNEQMDAEFCQKINKANADILWVGMTAPKQEIWVHKNRYRLNVAVIGNIGAVFDFTAGTYERAPVWARKMGLEWLIRLVKEPRRMWRRNFISPFIFSVSVIKYRIFSRIAVNKESSN
jgi:N-acetylglucosaminyldiphosphoundecaprenol N-acetyl-beta-D-mannosaminyltransferase